MAEPATRSPTAPGGLRRVLRGWAITLGFLAGMLVGAVVTGLLSQGAPLSSDIDAGTAAPEDPGAAPTDSGNGSAGATGEVVLNDACLRAINAAQDVVDVMEDLGEAISGFNAARLDEVVRRLQPLEQRLSVNAEDCEVDGRLPTEGADSSPSAASPTD